MGSNFLTWGVQWALCLAKHTVQFPEKLCMCEGVSKLMWRTTTLPTCIWDFITPCLHSLDSNTSWKLEFFTPLLPVVSSLIWMGYIPWSARLSWTGVAYSIFSLNEQMPHPRFVLVGQKEELFCFDKHSQTLFKSITILTWLPGVTHDLPLHDLLNCSPEIHHRSKDRTSWSCGGFLYFKLSRCCWFIQFSALLSGSSKSVWFCGTGVCQLLLSHERRFKLF